MLLDLIFGKKTKKPKTAPQSAPAPASAPPRADASETGPVPGSKINYHPQLIAQLKAEHQKLLAIFGAIQSSFQAGDLAATAAHLAEFRSTVHAHLLTENVRLYLYMNFALAQDPVSNSMMKGFRHEMDDIGKAVMGFLDKYKDIGSQPALAAGFAQELEAIGKVLVDRIQREEETLYPLYLPAY